METLFFEQCVPDPGMPGSFVYEDAAGQLAGFVGLVPRRMSIDGATIRVAIATQLMVSPGTPGLAGRRLVKALIESPYDLVLSDAANDAARRLWESAGGRTAVAYSLFWRRALRPLRAFTLGLGSETGSRLAALVARPLCAAGDLLLSSPASVSTAAAAGDHIEPFDLARNLERAEGILRQWELRPLYTVESVTWLVKEIERKRGSPPTQLAVHDSLGHLLGWAIYSGTRGGVGEVVQVVARPGMYKRVIAQLLADAHRRGLSGITGRLEPALTADLAASGATFAHEGPWMLVYSSLPGVMRAIDGGRALISRMDAEWWLSF